MSLQHLVFRHIELSPILFQRVGDNRQALIAAGIRQRNFLQRFNAKRGQGPIDKFVRLPVLTARIGLKVGIPFHDLIGWRRALATGQRNILRQPAANGQCQTHGRKNARAQHRIPLAGFAGIPEAS